MKNCDAAFTVIGSSAVRLNLKVPKRSQYVYASNGLTSMPSSLATRYEKSMTEALFFARMPVSVAASCEKAGRRISAKSARMPIFFIAVPPRP